MPRNLLAEQPQGQATHTAGELSPRALKLNTKRGANPFLRAVASVKTTPEGKASALEALGHEVITDPQGKIFLVDREAGQIFPLNEEEDTVLPTLGDVASLTGEVIEAAPTLTGPGKVISQAGRGVVGSALRQGVSAALPGEDFPKSVFNKSEVFDRAGQLAKAGAFGGGGQLAAHAGGAALRAIFNPSKFVQRRLQSLEARPQTQQGRAIERQTGVQLTPGQRTQSKSLLTIEGLLRRHPGTADIVESREARQLNQALEAFDRNLDTVTRRNVSPEGVGNAVRHGFGRVVDNALDIRSKQGRVDFGRIESLAEQAGDRNIFPTQNTQSAVSELIDEMAIEGATPQVVRGVVRELRQLDGLLKGSAGQAIPPRTMQQLLQLWGKAAQGTGRVFKDIDRGQERMIASRIFGALQRDLDASAASAGTEGPLAQALKVARDNWRENSKAIGELKDSALSRFVGADAIASKSPEAIAQGLLRAKPSELRGSMEILNRADPELSQQIKRAFFTEALEKAGRPRSRNRPFIDGEETFSPRKFVSAIKESPVWDVLEPQERQRLAVNARLLGRIARREGEGSPTAPLQFAWDLVKALGVQSRKLDISGTAATLSGVVSARRLADVMFNPKAESALRVMFSPKASNPRKTRAALTLGGLLAAGEARADVRPDEQGVLSRAASSRAPRNLLEGQGTSPQ